MVPSGPKESWHGSMMYWNGRFRRCSGEGQSNAAMGPDLFLADGSYGILAKQDKFGQLGAVTRADGQVKVFWAPKKTEAQQFEKQKDIICMICREWTLV